MARAAQELSAKFYLILIKIAFNSKELHVTNGYHVGESRVKHV